jgi:uncharacterized membrane protein
VKRQTPWLVGAVAGAIVVHAVVVLALPWAIMRVAIGGFAARAGDNTAIFPPRADETARAIVRPSPDLLYSACAFDISSGPVRITAQVPSDTYWSVSLFAANTDNFYKQNDREAHGAAVDLVLVKQGTTVALPPGATLVQAPTSRGIVLTRTLINDEAHLAELDQARRAFTCAPLAR